MRQRRVNGVYGPGTARSTLRGGVAWSLIRKCSGMTSSGDASGGGAGLSRDELYAILSMDEESFAKEHCELGRFKRSGPGGQHRNKVETGIRAIFRPTGTRAIGAERREIERNQQLAVRRLRVRVALETRFPCAAPATALAFPGSRGRVNVDNPKYPLFVAQMLDIVAGNQGQIRPAAEAFGLSTSALNRILYADKTLLTEIQSLRQDNGLKPLRK